ncbi:MAG: delta-60 repeat domain-containing protein [Flavobacteriales bacterium]|nr:delta-60 repeat domain-containing protein [Flavobacteriales bacterium]
MRLHNDGTLDTTFDPGGGGRDILDMARHSNGDVVIAGTFVSYDGIGRNRLARINDYYPVIQLSPRVLLGGAYDVATYMMEDGLRAAGLLPMTEPYTELGYIHAADGGEEVLAPGATSILGPNAIVDWVVVELLSPALPINVIASRSALVQRDGDVVAEDGVSPVSFNAPYGNYHIAIRHRNHLGVMSAAPIALSSSVSFIDFTNPATATYGTNAQQNINGTMVLWPGDANFNGEVKYTGTGNDRDLILTAIGGATPTNTVTNTYSPLDINMDGTIRYTGTNNDRDIILQTIGGVVPTAARIQQLP